MKSTKPTQTKKRKVADDGKACVCGGVRERECGWVRERVWVGAGRGACPHEDTVVAITELPVLNPTVDGAWDGSSCPDKALIGLVLVMADDSDAEFQIRGAEPEGGDVDRSRRQSSGSEVSVAGCEL